MKKVSLNELVEYCNNSDCSGKNYFGSPCKMEFHGFTNLTHSTAKYVCPSCGNTKLPSRNWIKKVLGLSLDYKTDNSTRNHNNDETSTKINDSRMNRGNEIAFHDIKVGGNASDGFLNDDKGTPITTGYDFDIQISELSQPAISNEYFYLTFVPVNANAKKAQFRISYDGNLSLISYNQGPLDEELEFSHRILGHARSNNLSFQRYGTQFKLIINGQSIIDITKYIRPESLQKNRVLIGVSDPEYFTQIGEIIISS